MDRTEPSSTWRTSERRVRLARDGSFIDSEYGQRTSLVARRALRAMLASLVEAYAAGDGRVLSSQTLASLGWPGERILPRAAANRVYVALTGLRKSGLGSALEHTGDGYRLSPSAPFELVELVEREEGEPLLV